MSDAVGDLKRALNADSRLNVHILAGLVRAALRASPKETRALLQSAYERALREAFQSSNADSVAEVATIGAMVLAAVGDQKGAIARLDQALSMAPTAPTARAQILGARAGYYALEGDRDNAESSLSDAREQAVSGLPIEAQLDLETDAAVVGLLFLDPAQIDDAVNVISAARASDLDWLASSLMVFYITGVMAQGNHQRASAWSEALAGYAAASDHPARALDATVAQLALRARSVVVEIPRELDERGLETFNHNALWRLRVLAVYGPAVAGQPSLAREACARLDELVPLMNNTFSQTSAGYAALVNALFEQERVDALLPVPPHPATLTALGGALAAAEATAIAGAQSRAADWLAWLETELPTEVVTSLEWPSCRARVEGLLLLRLGREREAVGRLQDGIRCCEEGRNPIQASIGQVQLAEALLRGTRASLLPASRLRLLGKAGAEELRRLGCDPVLFAYAASRTFLRDERLPERGGLTRREAQVLGRLAKGMSYREIGLELGINSRTVGVHASHCYEKLGVRNRVEAVEVARELSIV
jgi:ATP/maltotriose-dependent transcriptional regulator MalT